MIVLNTLNGEVIFDSHINISGEVALKKSIDISGNINIQYVKGKEPPTYEGDYVVIPRVYPQSLDTAGKKMLEDVTVKEVPRSEVVNAYNGITVTIG